MQAVILAAGTGSRLKELTKNNTKCMVQVNGVSLIERMLHQLEKQPIDKVVLVVGYERKKLMDYIDSLGIQVPIEYIENPIYDKTNNIYSLALAKDVLLQDDTILLESDLIFEDQVLKNLLEDARSSLMLVDKYERWMDGTCVELDVEDNITQFVPGKKFDFTQTATYYKTVNIYKFSKTFSETRYVPALEAYMEEMGLNDYYEQVLRVVLEMKEPQIWAKRLDGEVWYEIDDEQDLDIAESLFEPDAVRKAERIASRGGGYWRYPKIVDFSGAGKIGFPPTKLMDEMRMNLAEVMMRQSSEAWVKNLVAAKNLGIWPRHIVTGSHSEALLDAALRQVQGDFVVVKNPNFTGCYLKTEELLHLLERAKQEGKVVFLDETHVGIAEGVDSLLSEQKLAEYPNLVVIKDLAKMWGVPGLHVSVLASSNEELIAELQKDEAINPIDSVAEYFLQIIEKYKKDYAATLVTFCEERERFASELKKVEGIRVVPFCMDSMIVELISGKQAQEVRRDLLLNDNILVYDLTPEMQKEGKQYLRFAVLSRDENERLVQVLRKYV